MRLREESIERCTLSLELLPHGACSNYSYITGNILFPAGLSCGIPPSSNNGDIYLDRRGVATPHTLQSTTTMKILLLAFVAFSITCAAYNDGHPRAVAPGHITARQENVATITLGQRDNYLVPLVSQFAQRI